MGERGPRPRRVTVTHAGELETPPLRRVATAAVNPERSRLLQSKVDVDRSDAGRQFDSVLPVTQRDVAGLAE